MTGGTSLLGRTVAGVLLARGDSVTSFQRAPSSSGANDARGDVRDRRAVLRAVEG